MDIKKLTTDYCTRFNTYTKLVEESVSQKANKRKKLTSPNFLKEVIRPVLDALVELLPEYGFTPTTDKYAMYGDYYRIKAGIVLIGGFSIDENFGLIFTPLFHGQPCGESHSISDIEQLVSILRQEFERREIKKKKV